MSRERSPLRKKALKLWIDSGRTLKPAVIADALNVSSALVRKWKCIDKWDDIPANRPRGAPKGNRNAKGNKGGAPKGNKNAFKHGGYAAIWEDSLEWVEKMLLFEVDTDPVGQINNEIRLLEIRERRMLQLLTQLKDGWTDEEETAKSQLFDDDMSNVTVIDNDGKVTHMQITRPAFKEVEKIKKKQPLLQRILNVEEALTRVQDKKSKLIALKQKAENDELSREEAKLRIQKLQLEVKNMEGESW